MSKWIATTIGAIVRDHGGTIKTGPFGTNLKAAEYSSNGVPLISVGEIGHGRIEISKRTPRVPPAVTSRLPEYLLQPGDIIFGRKGAVDRSALVQPEHAGWFLGSDGIRLRLPRSVDARFVAYALQDPSLKAWIRQHATGTTMPSLNQQVVERIPIALPGLDEQRLIASTLSALDDKIELNRRTNEALEAMARSLFKSWFVDFDPVTAKAAGKKPFGMTDDLAALFPSEFTDSDQGPIPKGWRLERLDALCNFLSGGTPFKGNADYWGGSIPWVTAKDLKVQRLHDSELHITAKGLEAGSNMAPAGATLILVRGMSLHQEIRIGFCCRDVSFNQDVKAVSPKSPSLSSFVFLGIENVIADLLGMVDAASHGTGRLNTERLRSLQFAMPTPNLLPAFDAKVRHILDRLKANDVESMSLSMTRDLLLPKLLSGEIRLRDAERKIKEVV